MQSILENDYEAPTRPFSQKELQEGLKKLKDECEEELGVKDEPKTRGGYLGSSDYISPTFLYNLGNGSRT